MHRSSARCYFKCFKYFVLSARFRINLINLLKIKFTMTNTSTPTKQHGGKRSGAGRKPGSGKYGEASARVLVPVSAQDKVIDFVKALAARSVDAPRVNSLASAPFASASTPSLGPIWSDNLIPVELSEPIHSLRVPLFGHTVQAGFPSPADDYIAEKLDLNQHLMPHQEASFMLRAKGDSMIGANIHDGDLLVVDRSITATNGCVVIAAIDGQFTVKRLEKKRGKIRLLPANPNFEPIELKDDQELQIFGVVTNVIHSLKP
jgi:DNA polymerase V